MSTIIFEDTLQCAICLFAEEEEDSAPAKVEEQRKMSQDNVHPTTGNG